MTAQTSTQRSLAHRNREKAKVARMREALDEIDALCEIYIDGPMSIVGAIVEDVRADNL